LSTLFNVLDKFIQTTLYNLASPGLAPGFRSPVFSLIRIENAQKSPVPAFEIPCSSGARSRNQRLAKSATS
jgi:hypothetical protein